MKHPFNGALVLFLALCSASVPLATTAAEEIRSSAPDRAGAPVFLGEESAYRIELNNAKKEPGSSPCANRCPAAGAASRSPSRIGSAPRTSSRGT